MTCEICESDGKVTETISTEHGFPYDVVHCRVCGCKMAAPVSIHTQRERFLKLAGPGALKIVKDLGLA